MSGADDMLRDMSADKPTALALDRFIERAEQDDTVIKTVERIRARNQEIRKLYGLPERDYQPLRRFRDDRRVA